VHRYSGQHLGEAEGDEIILTKGVWRSPLLRPLASVLNVMGGGKPLAPSGYMAMGGVTQSSLVRESLTPAQPVIDYDRLAQSMEKVKIYTKTQEVMSSMVKVKYTQQLGND
jgi:hypothetical protein